jgi:hypothetical protein
METAELFQLSVLILERLQLAGIGHVHAAILPLAFVKNRIRDAVLARKRSNRPSPDSKGVSVTQVAGRYTFCLGC